MSDQEPKVAKDGFTVLKKGYTAPKEAVEGGFTPATGTLGAPPTSGTAVSKPPVQPKKD